MPSPRGVLCRAAQQSANGLLFAITTDTGCATTSHHGLTRRCESQQLGSPSAVITPSAAATDQTWVEAGQGLEQGGAGTGYEGIQREAGPALCLLDRVHGQVDRQAHGQGRGVPRRRAQVRHGAVPKESAERGGQRQARLAARAMGRGLGGGGGGLNVRRYEGVSTQYNLILVVAFP